MASPAKASFRSTILDWVASTAGSANKQASLAKDARLTKYECQLSWADDKVKNSVG
jgi:hypothetical protein